MEGLDANGDDDEEDPEDKSKNNKGGNKTMKHNVFYNEDTQDDVLSHSDRMDILDSS